MSTRASQRRRSEHLPAPAPSDTTMMHMTVDAGAVTTLRQLVMRICGDAMEFMRIQPCGGQRRMRVSLCVSKAAVGPVMDAVMQGLPGAQFCRYGAEP